MTEHPGTAYPGRDPRPINQRRIMPNVLVVPARELRDPVVFIVLVIASDGLLHGLK